MSAIQPSLCSIATSCSSLINRQACQSAQHISCNNKQKLKRHNCIAAITFATSTHVPTTISMQGSSVALSTFVIKKSEHPDVSCWGAEGKLRKVITNTHEKKQQYDPIFGQAYEIPNQRAFVALSQEPWLQIYIPSLTIAYIRMYIFTYT